MSLTTESSLTRRSPRFQWRSCCACPCTRRKVAPISPQPADSDFMALGRKGKRVICVFHIDPSVQNLGGLESLTPFARKIELPDHKEDVSGYLSDASDSNNDYWFTKWSRPLRTVRRLHKKEQQFKPQENPCPVSPDSGVINMGFDESPSDPESSPPPATITATYNQMKGNAVKPLLYFIHGAGGSAESWKRVMHFFAGRGYEVLALDLLGHGFSHTPKSEKFYTFKKLLGDVLSVFDAHVSNGRKVVIIGHGYGCSLAVALSRQRSSNVSLLALLSCGGPTPLAPPVTWRREWKLPASLLRCLRNLFLPCGLRRNVFYGPRGKSCLHTSDAFQSLPTYVRHHLAVGQGWPEGDVAFHRKVAVPTLLVHGLKDRYVSLVEMCEMERTIPRAFLEVIPEAGHEIQAEANDQLCKMLLKFVEHWQR